MKTSPKALRVLVACEYSGSVRDAFRALGHDAMSCDLLPTDVAGPHYQGSVFDIINDGWDLMIGHPPCTFLCNSGIRWLYNDGRKVNGVDQARWRDMEEACDFYLRMLEAPIPQICLENSIMHTHAVQRVGKCTQTVQPHQFGHAAFKGTQLRLKGLPLLESTNQLPVPARGTAEYKAWSAVHMAPPSADRWKIRAKTYQGIADAMAAQWGGQVQA